MRILVAIAAVLLLSSPALAQTGRLTVAVVIEGLTVAPTTITFPLTTVGTTSAPKTIIVNSVSGGQRVGSIIVTGPFRVVANHVQTSADNPDWNGVFATQSSGDLVVVFEPTAAVAATGTLTVYPMPTAPTPFDVGSLVRVNRSAGSSVRAAPSPYGTVLGVQAVGAVAKITGSTVSVDNGNEWWWPVQYRPGLSGWSSNEDLEPVPVCRWTLSYTPNGPGNTPVLEEKDMPMGGYDVTVDVVAGTSSRRVGAMTVPCQ